MSEMDWKRIYQEIQSRGCHEDFPQDLIDALRELVRQLDERYVKREEFEEHSKWLLSQQTAAWERMMDHIHGVRGELVFPHPPSDEIKPKAKCKCVDDYWITDICAYHGYPSFCCYCGNPLKEKFEKGKNEALSALDSERNEHAREVEDIKFRCTWLHSDLEQQVADLRKRIAELEAQACTYHAPCEDRGQ